MKSLASHDVLLDTRLRSWKEEWLRERAEDLRGFAVELLERHLEWMIRSAQALERH
jgi:hypothetical protein